MGTVGVICFLFGAASVTLEPRAASEPRFEQLDNGLTAIVIEDHALPLVSVQGWYRTGSVADPSHQPGLCHLTRTLLDFQQDATLRLAAAGVRFESATRRDACCFATTLPPELLDHVLETEVRRMQPLAAPTREQFDRALSLAAAEYHGYAERALPPDGRSLLAAVFEPDTFDHKPALPRPATALRNTSSDLSRANAVEQRLLAALFPGHAYQRPPAFVGERLADVTPEQVADFAARHFVPGNAVLLIYGDVATPQVLRRVRELFGKLEWSQPPSRAYPGALVEPLGDPSLRERIRIEVHRPTRVGVTFAWKTPPMGDAQNAAIDVLMQRLCNDFNGTLCGPFAFGGLGNVRWSRHAWREAGVLLLSIDSAGPLTRSFDFPNDDPVDAERARGWRERAIAIVDRLLLAAETEIPDPIEHNRARSLAEAAARAGRAAVADRARRFAACEVVAGDAMLEPLTLPRYRAMTVGQVQAAAARLNRTRNVVLIITPGDDEQQPAVAGASSKRLKPPPLPPAPTPTVRFDLLDWLGGSAVSSVSPPVAERSATKVETVLSDARFEVRWCPLPYCGRASVIVGTPREERSRFAVQRHLAVREAFGEFDPDPRDYLSYHGIRSVGGAIEPPWPAPQGGLDRQFTLPPERLAGLAEWIARARSWVDEAVAQGADDAKDGIALPWQVVVVGPPTIGDGTPTRDALLEGLRVEAAPADDAVNSSDETEGSSADVSPVAGAEAAVGSEPARRRMRIGVYLLAQPDGVTSIEIVLSPPPPDGSPTSAWEELQTLALLCGFAPAGTLSLDRPPTATLDDAASSSKAIVGKLCVATRDVDAVLRAFAESLRKLRDADVSSERLRTALRLVRIKEHTAIDSADAVARLIATGWDDERLVENSRAANADRLRAWLERAIQDVTFTSDVDRSRPGVPISPELCAELNRILGE